MSQATVRFGRMEQRGLLLGLSAVQVGLCGAAVVVAVLAEYGAGIPGVAVSAPIWGVMMAVAVVPLRGRPIIAWVPIWAGWTTRSRDGHSRQRFAARTRLTREGSKPVPLLMPGSEGRDCIWQAPASGAALVHDRAESTITGVLRVSGSGFVLADQGTRLGLISGWGQALSGLCHQQNVVRVQILARTVADSAEPMRRWWGSAVAEPSMWANRVASELLAQAQSEARRTETLLAVSIRPAKLGRRPRPSVLRSVEQILAGVSDSLAAAGLSASGWLDAGSIAHLLRTSFDPESVIAKGSESPAVVAEVVAGVGMDECWSSVAFDSGIHAVYWIAEWPRHDVDPSFLQPLVLGGAARRSLSLTVTPVPVARALRDIRRAKVEQAADAATRARTGRIEDESTRAEAADVARREQELVAGHGDLRFVGLLTVTADSPEDLEAACVATESAAAQAMCEVRRLVGQQSAAFLAGAVPLARRVS